VSHPGAAFQPAARALLERYTDEDWRLLGGFLRATRAVLADRTAVLRAAPSPEKG
jgi:hypothetical protein